MTITVNRELMPTLVDPLYELWITFDALPDQKKCRMDAVRCKYLQHLRRISRMRTVVEGQRDRAARTVPMI